MPQRRNEKLLNSLTRAISRLPDRPRGIVMEVLSGKRAIVLIGGLQYAVCKRYPWVLAYCITSGQDYTLTMDGSSCTCPQGRYKGDCKHSKALRAIL